MKLVTFVRGQTRLGALAGGDRVVDLNKAEPGLPTDMLAFINGGSETLRLAERAVAASPAAATYPLAAVTLKAPLARPGKIICIGLNYKEHAAESKMALPDIPVVFAKFNNCVIGPQEAVVHPKISHEVDYEAELCVVMGKRAKNVTPAAALDYVAGYTCLNDVSARDFQHRISQWTTGKTFDTFAPMGPVLVTADEIPDPQILDIKLSVNGEELQHSNTSQMIYSVPQLIAHLTSIMTLEPGDVIATGTPSGVGAGRTPQRWLRPGDVMRIEIERVGVLENPVVAES